VVVVAASKSSGRSRCCSGNASPRRRGRERRQRAWRWRRGRVRCASWLERGSLSLFDILSYVPSNEDELRLETIEVAVNEIVVLCCKSKRMWVCLSQGIDRDRWDEGRKFGKSAFIYLYTSPGIKLPVDRTSSSSFLLARYTIQCFITR
jgi:hypothetical protein